MLVQKSLQDFGTVYQDTQRSLDLQTTVCRDNTLTYALYKHTRPLQLSVSFSTLFWTQLVSLFYLSVSLGGCWALFFHTAGL